MNHCVCNTTINMEYPGVNISQSSVSLLTEEFLELKRYFGKVLISWKSFDKLRTNLGPLHLMDNLINEVFATDPAKSYVRKESIISRVASKDLNKSAAIATFEGKNEKKSRFPHSFWLNNSFQK